MLPALILSSHSLEKENKYHKKITHYSELHVIPHTSTDHCVSFHTVGSPPFTNIPTLAFFCSCVSFTFIHKRSEFLPAQVLSQRNALLSSTLASLWLRGWWNSLSRSLVVGSIGPKFLSAARRVLSIGLLVSAASACSDRGPAGGDANVTVFARIRTHARSRCFIAASCFLFFFTYPHSESRKPSWLSLSGWLHSPRVAELESAPSERQSASPAGRWCTSRDSASPVWKIESCDQHVVSLLLWPAAI